MCLFTDVLAEILFFSEGVLNPYWNCKLFLDKELSNI